MITYEYDVIFNNDVDYVKNLMLNKIPFGVVEPHNINCDKSLLNKLNNLYGLNLSNYIYKNNSNFYGINAGFQGINLKLFDNFISVNDFSKLLNLFDFNSIIDESGNEIWGALRTNFDTQEQSFYSILNQSHSENFVVLPTNEYYFWPCWDDVDGYIEKAMKSKIVHFTGHKKSNKLYELIDNFIEKK